MCDLVVAATGLRAQEATRQVSTHIQLPRGLRHKAYYPGAHQMHLLLTGDRQTGRLLGAQIIGQWHAEIAKRIDVLATAITAAGCCPWMP